MKNIFVVPFKVIFVVMRYMSKLRSVYTFYSRLGFEDSPDNTFVMSVMQFWRFLKDCKLHHSGASLCEMDRVLGEFLHEVSAARGPLWGLEKRMHISASSRGETGNIHNPRAKVLFREFINSLVTLAWYIFHDVHEELE